MKPTLVYRGTPGWSVVTHLGTLWALARAGWIEAPQALDKGHRYVFEGPKLIGPDRNVFTPFVHRRRTYRLVYIEGCFYPFVERYTPV